MLVGGLQVKVLSGVLRGHGGDGEVGGHPGVVEVDVGRLESETSKVSFSVFQWSKESLGFLPLVLAPSGDLQRLRPHHVPDDVVGRGVGVELQADHRRLSVIHVEGLIRKL